MTFQSNLNAAQASTQQDNIMNSFIKYYIDNELQLLKDLILGGAPEALDTLKELADAISSDPDFFQSMADSNAALQTAIDAVQADVDQNEAIAMLLLLLKPLHARLQWMLKLLPVRQLLMLSTL